MKDIKAYMTRKLEGINKKGLKVSKQAEKMIEKVWARDLLGIPKVAEFEIDDGLKDAALIYSLLKYLRYFEGHLLRITAHDARVVTEQNFSGAGKYLFYLA